MTSGSDVVYKLGQKVRLDETSPEIVKMCQGPCESPRWWSLNVPTFGRVRS
jgi:hypothetical protein